ncbi:14-3-3 family protein, partial [Wuchereria bancrofti]
LSLFDDARQNFQILIANYGKELTNEERNFFAVFYKSLLDKFRKEYNMFMDLQREIPRKEILKHRILRDNMYRARYEVVTICKEVIDMIDHGILDTKNIELKIYFIKLRADYFRYWSGVVSEDQFFGVRKRAEDSYQLALELADKKLKKYHPIRLALMLNMSIHYYAVPCERIKALQLSMQAVTEGKEHTKNDPDIRAVVDLLRDNLDAWMADLGPKEVHELEILEGARKWHGKGAAVPSAHLRRRLSGEESPKFNTPMLTRQRYFTIPQPYVRYNKFDDIYVCNYVPLKRNPSVFYEPLFEPETIYPASHKKQVPLTVPDSAIAKSKSITAELKNTQMESEVTTSVATTSSTVLAATGLLPSTAANQDTNYTEVPENIRLSTSHTKPAASTVLFEHASHEKHASYEERASHEEHVSLPDPFEGILQPILSFSSTSSSSTTSSSTTSLSTTSSQSLDEHDEDDNRNPEHRENRPSIWTSAPRDIPQRRLTPTTIDPISRLTKRLRSFESRMLSIKRSQLRLEQLSAERGQQPNEGNDSLLELRWTARVAANEEPQTPSNIIVAAKTSSFLVPQQDVTNEVSVPSYTQITNELSTVEELQPKLQNIPTDNCSAELQQRSIISSNQPDMFAFLPKIKSFAQRQQHQNISETEPKEPSTSFESFVFPEPAPPTPPPQVIFTAFGPKIVGNFSPTSSLEGAVAAVSPPLLDKKKRSKVVTFSEKCTYWPLQSAVEEENWNRRFSRQRTRRQRSSQQRSSTRPPPLRSPTPEIEEQVPCLPRSSQEMAVAPQQNLSPHQTSFYQQQLHRKGQALKSRSQRKLSQRKLLRRSFSAPREGATWPLSSLTREPPYFIYMVLRRASGASGQAFGRRFLSAHSSAEDLYDEAAERAFPDPWAPRGARTMHNTFPITPWYPNEKPRVPWIRHQWPYRGAGNEQNVSSGMQD